MRSNRYSKWYGKALERIVLYVFSFTSVRQRVLRRRQDAWCRYMLVRSLSMTQSLGYVQKGYRRWNGCYQWSSTRSLAGRFVFFMCKQKTRSEVRWHHVWSLSSSLSTRLRTATWLILPVVIRSSQRLSHACVSINLVLWNCEWLNISVVISSLVPYYLDNRSNSRANTCVNTL